MIHKINDKALDVDKGLLDVAQQVRAIQSALSNAAAVKESIGSYLLDEKFVEEALYNSMVLIDFVEKLYHELVDLSFMLKGASDGK